MNRKRVQMLRDMIAGIPESQINLRIVDNESRHLCATVACIGGWADRYPPFRKMGIDGDWSHFFGLGMLDEPYLFSSVRSGERGTGKEIALRRLDRLLATGTNSPLAKNV